jgi:Ca2+-binding RTX toxin-like protein
MTIKTYLGNALRNFFNIFGDYKDTSVVLAGHGDDTVFGSDGDFLIAAGAGNDIVVTQSR